MNTIDSYDKTASGQQEVAENAAGLSMMERRVLILVNGENDFEKLAKLSLCDDIEGVVNRLLQLDLIEVTEPTVVEAEAPAEAANDAPESGDDTDVHAVSARDFMCSTLQTFGNRVRIAPLHKQIAETTDLESLKQLVKPWYQSISETPGGMYQADDLRKEVLDMMGGDGVDAA
ncbi:MAG: hypothetical protein JSU67_13875 [Gammaproteobacteria bacterium]|nr:MAG: hypothetical protein JSU67_13875 [Gammaproteobacteria bacterium]